MTSELRVELFQAYRTLAEVNLHHAAKWCAEALNGLPPASVRYPPPELSPQEVDDYDRFILANSYFSCKEFERAAHTLKDCKSGTALFLRLYSLFLSVDKKAAMETDGSINVASYENVESSASNNGNGTDASAPEKEVVGELNSRLSKLIQEIESHHAKNPPHALLLFLAGMIYNKKRKYTLAHGCFLRSLEMFPYNWSCWQELVTTLTTFDDAIAFINSIKKNKGPLSSHIMFQFFEVVVLQEFYQQTSSLDESLAHLHELFPRFNFLKVQQFLIAYHGLDYFQAERLFDQILVEDPLRLDDLDTYSNMLYVMGKKSKLSFLTQYASQIDKFRPETCCITANYHSMKCEHDKAIMYYKRALTLNKNCLSAWTLMGHEFVELKNSHAAIESYRRAVDTNPKDFRAWYGLGQAYEVLDMHLYALYYYQRATNLQPLDKRMWQATGNCYEKIGKLEEALKAFEKALTIGSNENPDINEVEPHICYRIAVLSEKLARSADTHQFMKLCFEQEAEWGISDETSKARLWLARHALENKNYNDAYELAKDLNYSNAHDIEEARSIAREARNRMIK